jgi:hypothetical protein
MDEIVNLLAPTSILVAKGVEDNTAVYIYIFAKGIILEGVASIDNGRTHILFLLPCLLFKENLIILEIL